MAIIRKFIGAIILFFDKLFSPKGIKREPQKQQQIDSQTALLSLYQFQACPFCIKVRRQIKRLSLKIKLCDAKNNQQYREELQQNGGKIKVPCLRIDNGNDDITWMYESSDINQYLAEQFSST